MTSHLTILGLAATFLHIREIPGAKHNPLIVEMLRACGLGRRGDETPWCAAFVNHVLTLAGLEGTGSARARSFEYWGTPACDPVPGSIAVLSRGKPSSGKGHVAFVVRATGHRVLLLGGNQRNKVCARWYPKSRILSYRLALNLPERS